MTQRKGYPILHRDDQLLVANKPAGVLSVPGNRGGEKNVYDYFRRVGLSQEEAVFAIHRLDRDTSGVLIFALTAPSRDTMEIAFRERAVEKEYLALVHGSLPRKTGKVRSFITDLGMKARSSRKETRGGKEAITRYEVVESFDDANLVRVWPQTGRFNQIRLHMADLGCPLVGERKYAVASRFPLKHRRPLLHASSLRFKHPEHGGDFAVEAPLPEDFEAYLETLRFHE